MIIDFHSHNFPASIACRAMSAMCHVTEGHLWAAGDGTLANHLDHLQSAKVDKAVMCPIATKPTQHGIILRTACAIRDGAMGERAAKMIVPALIM